MNKTDEIDTLYNNKLKDLAHHKHAYDDHEPTCSSEKQGLTSMSSEIRDSNIEQFNIERVTPGVLADKNSSKFMTEWIYIIFRHDVFILILNSLLLDDWYMFKVFLRYSLIWIKITILIFAIINIRVHSTALLLTAIVLIQ